MSNLFKFEQVKRSVSPEMFAEFLVIKAITLQEIP